MFIDFVYFVPGLKVGFPGIFLDWNPEMSHFRKFQPERSSGILLLDPALNRHFPSRTSSEGLDGESTPLAPRAGGFRISLGDVGHAQACTQTVDEVARGSMGESHLSSGGRGGGWGLGVGGLGSNG